MEQARESDAALWLRALSGEGVAMTEIYDRHERRLFRAALRDADSSQDAEDVVATVFLELWRLRDRVRIVEDSLLPWLLTTSTNVSRNAARTRRRHRNLLAKLPSDPPAADASIEALDRVEALRDERQLGSLLRHLKPADRQILLLVGLDELTVHEAAAALGITPNTAKARLARARRRALALSTGSFNAADHLNLGETLA